MVKINTTKGFTLIEILLVVALVSIITFWGLFMSVDNYHQSSFINERDTLVSALTHARSQAINNVCIGTSAVHCTNGKDHGVHIKTSGGLVIEYIVFQGTTYNPNDPTNEIIQTNYTTSTPGPNEVYFERISGKVNAPAAIVLNGIASETSTINIGTEGQIYWDH